MNSGRFSKSLIYGVGADDMAYPKEGRKYTGNSSKVIWICDAYSRWKNMLRRCYHDKHISYSDVYVDEKWLKFSNFKAWYEAQVKPDTKYSLDKDLVKGSAKVYSEETCCLLPNEVNQFIVSGKFSTKLIGTCFDKERGTYQAFCKAFLGKRISLGRFKTIEEAHRAWQLEKITQLKGMMGWYSEREYKTQIVLDSLVSITHKLEKEYAECRITQDLKL
jgi:hypothetical protein